MPQTFEVTIFLRIPTGGWHSRSILAGCLTFSRELTLPFAPFPGLTLNDGHWVSGPIANVRFDVKGQRFFCDLETVQDLEEEANRVYGEVESQEEIDAFLETKLEIFRTDYLAEGWTVEIEAIRGD